MKHAVPLEPSIHYLLDILKVDSGDLPERVENSWRPLFALASKEKINFYLADLSLNKWNEFIPDNVRIGLINLLRNNKIRNKFLTLQMVKLAKQFREAEIPVMFLKGGAGLIRGLYPLECRYLSDIDALVPYDCIKSASQLLQSEGYVQNEYFSFFSDTHHHIKSFFHPDFVGEIEIHSNPYDISSYNHPAIPYIWRNADTLNFQDVKITVPSITDHVWILMRTDIISRPFLPRLCDVFEMYFIIENGNSIDFGLIEKRATQEKIPNIVKGMSYACSKYLYMTPFVPIDDPRLKCWEEKTLDLKRRILKMKISRGYLRKFIAIRFLTESGLYKKISFLGWLFRTVSFQRFIIFCFSPEIETINIIMKIKKYINKSFSKIFT